MADRCLQCTQELREKTGDAVCNLVALCEADAGVFVVCEGCGVTFVDNTGRCRSDCTKHHGSEKLPPQIL